MCNSFYMFITPDNEVRKRPKINSSHHFIDFKFEYCVCMVSESLLKLEEYGRVCQIHLGITEIY